MEKGKKGRLNEYKEEFSRWLRTLSHYHTRFNENYKRYTAYNETTGTESRITDPVATELVERVNQKLFERDPKFYADSQGKNLPREVKGIIASVAEFLWSNPDVVQASGPMRQKLKVGGREFCITGNLATEVFYNNKADAPDGRIVPVEDIVFDPTKTLKTSPRYYIRQFVSLEYLKDNVEIKKDDEVVTGIFPEKAIKKLERTLGDKNQKRQDPTDNQINRSGGDYERNVDAFQLITRVEGDKCCRFVIEDDEESPILLQEYTNEVLGTHPYQFAMDIEVPKQPYGFSFLDQLNGLIKAKDLILNQVIDYGSKVLNPPTIVNPSLGPVNLKTVSNMYKLGGIVLGDPNQIAQKPMPSLGNQGIEMLTYIEQRSESVSGIGAYLAGIPNQTSDKTQGTKGGIEALINQASSPITDRQQNIEESIIEPMVNKWLKMVGATMTDGEFKWVLVTGENPKWIKVTKGFLTGKIKMIDLMQAGVIEDPEIQAIVDLMMIEGKDPEEDILFDVDWLIKVETGSLAERDAVAEVEKKQSVVRMGLEMGLPINTEKAWKDIAMDAGIKEPEQYLNKEMMNPMMPAMAGMSQGGQMPMHTMPNGTQMPGATHPAGAI